MTYAVIEHNHTSQEWDITFYDDLTEAEFYQYTCVNTSREHVEANLYSNSVDTVKQCYSTLEDYKTLFGDYGGVRYYCTTITQDFQSEEFYKWKYVRGK